MSHTLTRKRVRDVLPERPVDGHKGTFGHLFAIAGSRGFTGAAKLTCRAAGRSGVGLVTLGVPHTLSDVVGASLLETMSIGLAATDRATLARAAVAPALEYAEGKQAVVLGPGISQHEETKAFVHEFVPQCSVPLLIDADGLNAIATDLDALDRRTGPTVLTPHPGEMARLSGLSTKRIQADRDIVALEFAERHSCVVVLKGHRTVVANPEGEYFINETGNSGMATGGTGDVLAGLIGGLMAQGVEAFDAALIGVFLHGLAGDIAAENMTERAMLAGDLVESLPDAWRVVEKR
ncbi:MAG: NAD(P)H-hydrate dehydratase [Candidatus Hydrogenedentes bacterium]|nr:NAD(P)H-hydrate dehydratase [Candidatus Hydrogenedentota bacterium]